MKYFLALVLPPVAVLWVRPSAIFLNLFLCFFAVIPGIIHALILVAAAERKSETDRVIAAIKESK